MTHDEIDKLEAGVDLDALIAEKVMGWKLTPRNTNPTIDWDRWYDANGVLLGQRPWGFSSNIAAAWEVVEKMLPVIGHIYPQVDDNGKLLYWVAVIDRDVSRVGVLAPTAPLAICRAALKAVSR